MQSLRQKIFSVFMSIVLVVGFVPLDAYADPGLQESGTSIAPSHEPEAWQQEAASSDETLVSDVDGTQDAANDAMQASTEAPALLSDEALITASEGIQDDPVVIDKGTCGDDLTWKYYDDATLVISGSGDMGDYEAEGGQPWNSHLRTIEKVVIEEGATSIGSYAFYHSYLINSVELPSTLTSIGDYAFNGNESLKSIDIPDTVTYIGDRLFERCLSLKQCHLPEGVESLPSYLFYYCRALETVNIPSSVKTIGDCAFYFCGSMLSLDFPQGLISVGTEAFYLSKTQSSVTIPASLVDLGRSAFNSFKVAGTLTFAEGITSSILYNIASMSRAETVHFPASIERISVTANAGYIEVDEGNPNYQSIDGVLFTRIGSDGTIYDDKSAALQVCPRSIEGEYSIPDGTVEAYPSCLSEGVVKVNIPGSVVKLGDFSNNRALEDIEVDESNPMYSSRDGILFDKEQTRLITCPVSHAFSGSYEIPETVTVINASAFNYSKYLTGAIIPSGVTELPSACFASCGLLTVVFIPATVTVIGTNCFYPTGAYYPDRNGFTVFYEGSEEDWAKVNIRKYNDGSGNAELEAATHYNNARECGVCEDGLLYYLDNDGTLRVLVDDKALEPVTEMADYLEAGAPWFKLGDAVKKAIVSLGITNVSSYAFDGLESLESAELARSITSVGESAFSNCPALRTVECFGDAFEVRSASAEGSSFDASKVTLHYKHGKAGWTDEPAYESASRTWNGYAVEEDDAPVLPLLATVELVTEVTAKGGSGYTGYPITVLTDQDEDITDKVSVEISCPPREVPFVPWVFASTESEAYYDSESKRVMVNNRAVAGDYVVTVTPVKDESAGDSLSTTFTVARESEVIDGVQGWDANVSGRYGVAYNWQTSKLRLDVWNQYGESVLNRCSAQFIDVLSGQDVTDDTKSLGFYLQPEGTWLERGIVYHDMAKSRDYDVIFTSNSDNLEGSITGRFGFKRYSSYMNIPYSLQLNGGETEMEVSGDEGQWTSVPYKVRVLDAYDDPCWPRLGLTVLNSLGEDVSDSFALDEQGYLFISSEIVDAVRNAGAPVDYSVQVHAQGKGRDDHGAWVDVERTSNSLPLSLRYSERVAATPTHTATFVIGDTVVAQVSFTEGDSALEEPSIPKRDNYVGAWEPYDLASATDDITVNGVYTPIDPSAVSDIEASATANHEDGAITINLAASARTKAVRLSHTVTKPVDVVLVCDQSGSMKDVLGSGQTKRDALVECANRFVENLYDNAVATGADHRVALVGFAYSSYNNGAYKNTGLLAGSGGAKGYASLTTADYKSALLPVNSGGAINSAITDGINSIKSDGATAADVGLKIAKNVLAENPVGTAEDGSAARERIVVFITDGVPTSWGLSSSLVTATAANAISMAKTIKQGQGARIYSVGVDADANPAAAFTAQANGLLTDARGNYVSYDFNRFLHAVSSNYPEATGMDDIGSGSQDSGFYMAVNNTSNLEGIFTSILYSSVYTIESFDRATLSYTLPSTLTLTMKQESELRASLAQRGLTDDDIIVETQDGGTTKLVFNNVPVSPETVDGEVRYLAHVTFQVSANETAESGSEISAGVEEGSGVLQDGSLESGFDIPVVEIPSDRCLVVFKMNDAVYEIRELAEGDAIEIPATDLARWLDLERLENPKATDAYAVFETTSLERTYSVRWVVGEHELAQDYAPGAAITVPDQVVEWVPEGYTLTGWSPVVPATMPNRSITCTAVVTPAHVHEYTYAQYQTGSCTEGISIHRVCACGEEVVERAASKAHSFEAVLSNSGQYGLTVEKLVCADCGHAVDKNITYQVARSLGRNSIVLNLSKSVGEVVQNGASDDDISMRLYVGGADDQVYTVTRIDEDGTKTSYRTYLQDGYLVFDPDHFSVYAIEAFTEGQDATSTLSYDECLEIMESPDVDEVAGDPEGIIAQDDSGSGEATPEQLYEAFEQGEEYIDGVPASEYQGVYQYAGEPIHPRVEFRYNGVVLSEANGLSLGYYQADNYDWASNAAEPNHLGSFGFTVNLDVEGYMSMKHGEYQRFVVYGTGEQVGSLLLELPERARVTGDDRFRIWEARAVYDALAASDMGAGAVPAGALARLEEAEQALSALKSISGVAVTVNGYPSYDFGQEPLDFAYTGRAIDPNIVVKDGEVELREGVDYTIEYAYTRADESFDELRTLGTYSAYIVGAGAYYDKAYAGQLRVVGIPVNAILYKNGDLVIQPDLVPDGAEGHTAADIVAQYSDVNGRDSYGESPWADHAGDIVRVATNGTCQPESLYWWFNGCSNLVEADLSGLDVSGAFDFSGTFRGADHLQSVNLSGWDTSNARDMTSMFYGCSALTEADLGAFNTSNVRFMDYMFNGDWSLASLNLEGFDTSGLTEDGNRGYSGMGWMFSFCSSLVDLKLGARFAFGDSCALPAGLWILEGSDVSFCDESEYATTSVFAERYDGSTMAGVWHRAPLRSLYGVDVDYADTLYEGSGYYLPIRSVSYEGEVLEPGEDYCVMYDMVRNGAPSGGSEEPPMAVGEHSATVMPVEGGAPWYGWRTVNYTVVERQDISGWSLYGAADLRYTGEDLDHGGWELHAVDERYLEHVLQVGSDCTITYADSEGEAVSAPREVGAYTATVAGLPYIGSFDFPFEVKRGQSINDAQRSGELGLDVATLWYNGEPQEAGEAVRSVSIGGQALGAGDYEASILGSPWAGDAASASEAATYYLRIAGKGDYFGAVIVPLEVKDPRSLANAEVSSSEVVYTTDSKLDPITSVTLNGVELSEGEDYSVQYFEEGMEGDLTASFANAPFVPGTYTAVATGTGDLSEGGGFYGSIAVRYEVQEAVGDDTIIDPNSGITVKGDIIKQRREEGANVWLRVDGDLYKPRLDALEDLAYSLKGNSFFGGYNISAFGISEIAGTYADMGTLTVTVPVGNTDDGRSIRVRNFTYDALPSGDDLGTYEVKDGAVTFTTTHLGGYHGLVLEGSGDGIAESIEIYRLYNPSIKQFTYSSSQDEIDSLVNRGWKNEGLAWVSPPASKELTSYKRVKETFVRDSTYLASDVGYDFALADELDVVDGILGYSSDSTAVPVYEAYAQQFRRHIGYGRYGSPRFYTTSLQEYNDAISLGWTGNGVAFYAQAPGADYSGSFSWSAGEFAVEFDSNGGSAVEPQRVARGAAAVEPAEAPVRDGYAFGGWLDESGSFYDFSAPVASTVSLKALWIWQPEASSYIVSFDSAGGSPVAAAEVGAGEALERPDDPTRDGFEFGSWQLDGVDYDFASEVSKNITLVAQWNPIAYDISYALDGGVNAEGNPTSYTVESEPVQLVAPTRGGYTFTGWTGSNGSEPQLSVSTDPTILGGLSYTAHWVEVDKSALADALDAARAAYGTTKASVDGFDVYVNETWATQANLQALADAIERGQATAAAADATQQGVDEAEETLGRALDSLGAANGFKPLPVSVTFKNGDETLSSKKYDIGTPASAIELPETPTKPEEASCTYEFSGWSPELADVAAEATYTATFTAVPKSFTVSFYEKGAIAGKDLPLAEGKVQYGMSANQAAALAEPTIAARVDLAKLASPAAHYRFDSWRLDDGTAFDFDAPFKADAQAGEVEARDYVLYASYAPIEYALTYDTGGGILTVGDAEYGTAYSMKYTVEDLPISLPGAGDIARNGYAFAGWFEDGGGNAATSISIDDAGDKAFAARWMQNVVVDDLGSTTFNGKNQMPTLVVKGASDGGVLAADQYEVSWRDATGALQPSLVNAGVYSYSLTPKEGSGYNSQSAVTGAFTISRAPLSVRADNAQKVYGDPDPALTWAALGVVEGDDFVPDVTIARTGGEDVGQYPIVVSGEASQGNYSVAFEPGTLDVTARAAVVAAHPARKGFGEEDPAFTASAWGLVEGDEQVLEYAIAREAGENAGTYRILPTGEADQGNYSVTFEGADFVITRVGVPAPSARSYQFDGREHTGVAGSEKGRYGLAGTPSATAIGDYEVTAALSDKDNYYWIDGDGSNDLLLSWSILPADLDLSELRQAISEAENMLTAGDYAIADDAFAVLESVEYVAAADWEVLKKSVEDARSAMDSSNATQDGVDEALRTLGTAVEAFEQAKKDGALAPSSGNTQSVDVASQGEEGVYVTASGAVLEAASGDEVELRAENVTTPSAKNVVEDLYSDQVGDNEIEAIYEISLVKRTSAGEELVLNDDCGALTITLPIKRMEDGKRTTVIQIHRDVDGEVSALFTYHPIAQGGYVTITVFNMLSEFVIVSPQSAQHTVTFDPDNGDASWEVMVDDGAIVAKPESDPSKSGCTFAGWQLDGSAYDFAAPVTGSITLKAAWNEKPADPVPTPTPTPTVATQAMHRLYNPYSGEHFYTSSTSERDTLRKAGWSYEGTGWTAPVKSNTPVYRLYNAYAGDHHYTTSADERDTLRKAGWNYEGIGWYSDDSKKVPLYRQYNPYASTGSHNYTTSKAENDQLVKLGWKAEGIGWYGV